MAGGLMVGTVLFASEETILLTDRGPDLDASATSAGRRRAVVVEYDVVEGRNVMTKVPAIGA